MKRLLRSAQTHFPFIRPLKFGAYNFGTRTFGWRIDAEFKLLERMRGVGLALDIGGNWGQSIYALLRTAKPSKIISFEPNPSLATRLSDRFADDQRVEIRGIALSDVNGTLDLHVPRYRNFIYDGLASLDPVEAGTWLNPRRMNGFDASKLHIDTHHIPTRRLDDLALSPDVVKIDVQGTELQVVRGGLETFRRTQPVSIVESPTDELVALFAEIGMAPFRFDGHELSDNWRNSKNVVFMSEARRTALSN